LFETGSFYRVFLGLFFIFLSEERG